MNLGTVGVIWVKGWDRSYKSEGAMPNISNKLFLALLLNQTERTNFF